MNKFEMNNFNPVGIIRQLDDLGRIVIPRDLRARIDCKEGDAFEIFVEETSKRILLVPIKQMNVE